MPIRLTKRLNGYRRLMPTLESTNARKFKEWRDDGSMPNLHKYLSNHLDEPEPIIITVAGSLDGAGLTLLGSALSLSHYRVFEQIAPSGPLNSHTAGSYLWAASPLVTAAGSGVALATGHVSLADTGRLPPKQSPVESARTPLGTMFMDFCSRS
jgi:hypothetical protein